MYIDTSYLTRSSSPLSRNLLKVLKYVSNLEGELTYHLFHVYVCMYVCF
ncbi:hypothetical protein J5U23_02821 [Saccharolobus shibatae B12]|uniref:Uncharacterized protein n=1 Tax=Saccharolobus shibatae (strain ATCC 51178 / DSM 5389 / JCM 8931 / NBRC 15437 / B12) TaxID=523848 RepID=A0A8F5BRD3_SACSH|nr:hypothetical protein J5U23_02821 [Saccharolobus shibatae B12]